MFMKGLRLMATFNLENAIVENVNLKNNVLKLQYEIEQYPNLQFY